MMGEVSLACLLNFCVLIIILTGLTVGASNNTTQDHRCDGLNFEVVEQYLTTDYVNVTLLSPANCDEDSTSVMEITAISNTSSYLRLEMERIELKWNQSKAQPLLLNNLEALILKKCKLNPHSIQFTENLKILHMIDSRLINGTLEDLLKTASQIEELGLFGMRHESEIEDGQIFLKSLKRFALRGGWPADRYTPLPFRFSDSLDILGLVEMNITDGNLRSLLESATQLREVRLESVQVLSDTSGTNPLGFDDLPDADSIRGQNNPNSTAYGERLDFFQKRNAHPILLKNLEKLSMLYCKLNPHSIQFTENLKYLDVYDAQLINGTLADLLKTSSQIEIIDFFGTWYETEIEDGPIFLKSLKRLDLQSGWNEDMAKSLPFHFGDSLDFLSLHRMNITERNLRSLLESAPRLKEVVLCSFLVRSENSGTIPQRLNNVADAEFIRSRNNPNSILFDLLRNASGLESLTLCYMGEVDLASLRSSKLTDLSIRESKIYKTVLIIFDELNHLDIEWTVSDDPTIFDDFDVMFPKIRTLSTGIRYLVSPSAVPALFRSSATQLSFSFDFEPQIKTFEFGEAMKIIKNAGLKEINYPEETILDGENRVRETRARYITFKKTSTENGTDKWEQGRDSTHYWDATVDDIKPPEEKLVVYIYVAILSILICVGIFGNILSTIVLARRKLKNSAEIVLLSLTFYDGLVILTYLTSLFFSAQLFFRTFVETRKKSTFPTDEYSWIAEQNPVQAFLVYPLNKTGYTGSVYSTVLITLERFVAICFPLNSRTLLRPRNSKVAVLLIFTFSAIINVPRWIESYEWDYYDPDSRSWNEYYRPTLRRMQMYGIIYHGFLWPILMYILPFVLVGYFNFKILQHIKISRWIRETLQQTNETSAGVTDSTGITRMLLCVVGVFVVCNALHIAIVAYFFTKYQNIELSTIEAISCFPIIVNSSVNFIIYILLGKTLRAEFMKLIPKCVPICFDRERINEIPGANIPMETIGSACNVST